MIVYLASPESRLQLETVKGMPVLLSFALVGKNSKSKIIDEYQPTFSRLLIDSGAFSEMNTRVKIDLKEYAQWSKRWQGAADAIAGLDDISGDWRRSLKNYECFSDGFPTIHDSDPPKLLPDLVQLCQLRKQWLGIGLKLPRHNKERFVRWVCDNIPETIHVHGWALRAYTHIRRLDSVDSTNWWRDAMRLRRDLPWLTYGECLELIVKRYQRWKRVIRDKTSLPTLFDDQ